MRHKGEREKKKGQGKNGRAANNRGGGQDGRTDKQEIVAWPLRKREI